ncbi:MAG: potassium transporter TrkG, partial [Anaerovorax sp.]
LIFAISILPSLGIGGQKIIRGETPVPTLEKAELRLSDSAKILYLVYILFTILAIFFLKLGGLNFFDTITHAFSSMGTGGLFNYANGVAQFDTVYVQMVMTVFSLLASINFVMYHHLIHGHWRDCFEDAEFKAFFIILGSVILLLTLNLWINGTYESLATAFKHSFFQTSAFMSTASYASADYTLWPTFCQMLLFILLFIGGCSASTCGSIKVIRVLVFIKLIARGLNKRLHPTAVVSVKISGKTISAERISTTTNFLLLYFAIFVISVIIISLDNLDMTTTISASAAILSNTGMGMGLIGPSGSFEIFSAPIRLYLSFLMLVGRLELFAIIVLLTPSFWNPAKKIHL